jgi:hypothetical protein
MLVEQSNGKVFVNGKEIPLPDGITNNVTIINGDVFVNGKQYIDGEWKVTLRALWHKLF